LLVCPLKCADGTDSGVISVVLRGCGCLEMGRASY